MQFQLEIPTTQKVDHLIVISPPDEIMSIAWEIKQEVEKIVGVYKSRTSTPHITICRGLKKDSLIKLEDYMSKRVCDKEFYVKDLLGLRADSRDVKYQKRFSFKLKE